MNMILIYSRVLVIVLLCIAFSGLLPSVAMSSIFDDIVDTGEDIYNGAKDAAVKVGKYAWNSIDDAVKDLSKDFGDLGKAVLKCDKDVFNGLVDLYNGDTKKLWSDVKHMYTDGKDVLDAAARLGIDSWDDLTKPAQDLLREIAQKAVDGLSTSGIQSHVRGESIGTNVSSPSFTLINTNNANIVSIGGFEASVKACYKGICHTFLKMQVGSSNNVVNYGTLSIRDPSKMQEVYVEHEIQAGNHHYYGVNVNVGSFVQ